MKCGGFRKSFKLVAGWFVVKINDVLKYITLTFA